MGTLRCLLALAVLLYHLSGYPIFGLDLTDVMIRPISGKPAVETFFIISGFAMAGALSTRYRDSTPGRFYLSRVLRLYPAYWLILIAELAAAATLWHYGLPEPANLWAHDAGQPLLERLLWSWSNLAILGKEVWFLGDGTLKQFVIPAWSLSVELQFYLLIPFLMKWPTSRLVALFAAAAAYRVLLFAHYGYVPAAYYMLPWQLCLFLAGVLSYRVLGAWQEVPVDVARWPALAMLLLTVLFPHFTEGDRQADWIKIGYWLMLFWTLPLLSRLSEGSRIDAFLGDLSYPLYLAHLGIIYTVVSLPLPPWLVPWGAVLIVVGASLAVGVLVVRTIDHPMTLIRRRLAMRARPVLAIA